MPMPRIHMEDLHNVSRLRLSLSGEVQRRHREEKKQLQINWANFAARSALQRSQDRTSGSSCGGRGGGSGPQDGSEAIPETIVMSGEFDKGGTRSRVQFKTTEEVVRSETAFQSLNNVSSCYLGARDTRQRPAINLKYQFGPVHHPAVRRTAEDHLFERRLATDISEHRKEVRSDWRDAENELLTRCGASAGIGTMDLLRPTIDSVFTTSSDENFRRDSEGMAASRAYK
ncbi:hypothetical protein M405DRAFT_878742 [Rhizopogon salebrosus TDB-379]|nr:hypothetical protein M405DRAFT_878742 [Rhizopogon salebrosus TDB-379]